jgi:hypothetical protein
MRHASADAAEHLIARNEPAVFAPWLGEFGLMVLMWMRFVHHSKAGHKVVCARRGEEDF